MGVNEARDYIEGMNRRYRQDWERTRLESSVLYKVMSGKDLELEFPWETEDEDKEETQPEDLERLREKARIMERIINGNK